MISNDGRRLLYATGPRRGVAVRPLDAFDATLLDVSAGVNLARYVPTGHIVFGFEGTLTAVPFDLNTLETAGSPATTSRCSWC